METLIDKELEQGGFGGPVLIYSRIEGHDAFLFGGRGGWIIDHRFVLGGGGFGLVSDVQAPSSAAGGGEELQLGLGYGGIWLEYVFNPEKIIHASVGTFIGAGGASYSRSRGVEGESAEVESDAVFIVDPTVSAELNVLKFMRLGVGISYRYVGGLELTGLDSQALNGFTGQLTIKFGGF